jgi:penicillin G amidase
MNQQRWAGHGKLSQCLAATEELIQIDVFLRNARFAAIAEEILERLSAKDLAYFQAYADGVNHFLEERKQSLSSMRYFHYFTGVLFSLLISLFW